MPRSPPMRRVIESRVRLLVLCAFIARCSVSNDPASFVMARSISLLTCVLGGATWSRILTELRDSGLFANVYTTNCATFWQRFGTWRSMTLLFSIYSLLILLRSILLVPLRWWRPLDANVKLCA